VSAGEHFFGWICKWGRVPAPSRACQLAASGIMLELEHLLDPTSFVHTFFVASTVSPVGNCIRVGPHEFPELPIPGLIDSITGGAQVRSAVALGSKPSPCGEKGRNVPVVSTRRRRLGPFQPGRQLRRPIRASRHPPLEPHLRILAIADAARGVKQRERRSRGHESRPHLFMAVSVSLAISPPTAPATFARARRVDFLRSRNTF